MPLYEMMVMAARMAMITMTMRSSTRVKAEDTIRLSCFSEDNKDLKNEATCFTLFFILLERERDYV